MSAAVSTPARSHPHSTWAPWPLIECAISHWSSDQAATIGAAQIFLLGAEFTACCGGARDAKR